MIGSARTKANGLANRTPSLLAYVPIAIAILIGAAATVSPVVAAQPVIWLAPLDPRAEPGGLSKGSEDYLELFSPGAPWAETASHVAAFKIYPEFARHASDSDLDRVIAGLADRHIPLALEGDILIRTSRCEPGLRTGQGIIPTVARLKQLGGDLRYIAMNGPLVSGHTQTKPFSCHAPIKDVAADAADTIRALRKFYPNLAFGDIEPVGHAPNYPDWRELPEWFAAFKAGTGMPLAFIHTDITWGLPWRGDLQVVARLAHEAGIPFGVILNSDGYELSDADYARSVQFHEEQVAALPGVKVDHVVFQSWVAYPKHAMPESDPSSMTGVVLNYLRPPTRLVAAGPTGAGQAQARLMDAEGRPLAGAEISAEMFDPRPEASLVTQSIAGTVPPGAREALFALRMQTESAFPRESTHLSIAAFQYAEHGRPTFHWDLQAWAARYPAIVTGALVGDVRLLRITGAPGQAIALNGPRFPVTPDEPFQASFSWQVDPSAADAGYAALIFIGADGIELHRARHVMSTTWRPVEQVQTNAEGLVIVSRPPSLPPDGLFRLRYAGDHAHRPASSLEVTFPP
jgi:hypothetical protein